MASGCLAKVVCSDVKHNFLIHYLAAAGVLAIAPVLFGLSGLSERMAALVLEILSPVIGTILMTPVFMPEQNEGILDVVRSKKTSHTTICFLRLLCSAAVTVALMAILAGIMRYNDSQVTLRIFVGAAGSAAALGSLGFFAAAVGDSAVAGYMVSAAYFLMNLFLRDKLGVFSLFNFSGGKTEINLWLYAAAAVLVVIALVFRRLARK